MLILLLLLKFLLGFSCFTWRRWWHPTPVLLPGKSHGRRSLVGCSPWGREQSDTTEQLPFHFSLSCTGEGNGNPLQDSCLENPRDGRAWWSAVSGVAQSRTRLTGLGSSSCFTMLCWSLLYSQFTPPSPSPMCPQVCSLHLHLYSCPANRFIQTIFLDSTYMHHYMIFDSLFLTSLCITDSRSIHLPTVFLRLPSICSSKLYFIRALP